MSTITCRLPSVDMIPLRQRRALDTIRSARRQADTESAKTMQECDYDAKVRMMSPPSTTTPFVITATPPRLPYYIAAFAALMLLLGGVVLRSNVASMAASWQRQGTPQLDMGSATAASSSEWRDGVSDAVEVKP